MQLTATVTADAQVNTTKGNKQVVNFTVAVNDSYKPKDGDRVKVTEFIRCAYWRNPSTAQYLTKGTVVELYGRLGVDAYTGKDGQPKASITCHVNDFKFHGGSKKDNVITQPVSSDTPVTEDLPF